MPSLVIAWDADLLPIDPFSDDVEEKRVEYQRQVAALDVLKSWLGLSAGMLISESGKRGCAEIPAHVVDELPRISDQYSSTLGDTVSFGVGSTMSDAKRALKVAKARGGDRMLLWSDDMYAELERARREGDKDYEDEYGDRLHTDHDEEGDVDKSDMWDEESIADLMNALGESWLTIRKADEISPEEANAVEGPGDNSPTTGQAFQQAQGPESAMSADAVTAGQAQSAPPAEKAPASHEEAFHGAAKDTESREQAAASPKRLELKQQVVEVLTQVKQQAPAMEALKDQAPDMYQSILATIQAMQAMAAELVNDEQEEAEEGEDGEGEDKKDSAPKEDKTEKAETEEYGGAIQAKDTPKEPLGTMGDLKVFLVDGSFIRDYVDIEFTEGGNHERYEWIPEGEAWLENSHNEMDVAACALHELYETHLMRGGMSYDDAHEKASTMEKEFREEHENKGADFDINFAQAYAWFEQKGYKLDKSEVRDPVTGRFTKLMNKDETPGTAKPCKHFFGRKSSKCLKCKEPKPVTKEEGADTGADPSGAGAGNAHRGPKGGFVIPETKIGYHQELNLPAGTVKEGKIKVTHPSTGKTSWKSARAGAVLSNDGHAVSSRNPGGS
jgi:hypothetical protein